MMIRWSLPWRLPSKHVMIMLLGGKYRWGGGGPQIRWSFLWSGWLRWSWWLWWWGGEAQKRTWRRADKLVIFYRACSDDVKVVFALVTWWWQDMITYWWQCTHKLVCALTIAIIACYDHAKVNLAFVISFLWSGRYLLWRYIGEITDCHDMMTWWQTAYVRWSLTRWLWEIWWGQS